MSSQNSDCYIHKIYVLFKERAKFTVMILALFLFVTFSQVLRSSFLGNTCVRLPKIVFQHSTIGILIDIHSKLGAAL